jgi:hypothetical protein
MGRGYILRWKSEAPIQEYEVQIEELNFYDGEEDVIVKPVVEEMKWTMKAGTSNSYMVSFDALLAVDLTEAQLEALEARDMSVDYCLRFVGKDGKLAKPDNDYLLLHNYSLVLEVVEPR